MSGLDNNPNSIFRASRTVKNIINKQIKKEQDAKNAATQDQQQGLKPIQTSNVETDVNKNLSLFTLDIKQITNLLDSFIDFIYSNQGLKKQLDFIHSADTEKIKKKNEELRKRNKKLYGGGKKKNRRNRPEVLPGSSGPEVLFGKQGSISSVDSGSSRSYIDPFQHSRSLAKRQNVVRSSQINSAPVGEVSSDSEGEGESLQGSVENVEFGGMPDSDPDSSDSESDGDPEFNPPSQLGDDFDDDDFLSQLTESEKGDKSNINLVRELNRISNLVQHAFSLWDDYISPNILYLSKVKMSNFLNSQTIDDFEHSVAGFDNFFASNTSVDYPDIQRVAGNVSTDLDNLFDAITRDIKKVSGINTGSSSDVDGSTNRTITGAGFLHFPSPYNNYMHHTRTKYLM
jgi:hypothetical protein